MTSIFAAECARIVQSGSRFVTDLPNPGHLRREPFSSAEATLHELAHLVLLGHGRPEKPMSQGAVELAILAHFGSLHSLASSLHECLAVATVIILNTGVDLDFNRISAPLGINPVTIVKTVNASALTEHTARALVRDMAKSPEARNAARKIFEWLA